MGLDSCKIFAFLLILESWFRLDFAAAIDRISLSQPLKDPEAITSSGGIFKLGFFSPTHSLNRYVGIWYNIVSVTTPVWVANRMNPLNDSSGTVTISGDGNLVVLNGKKETLWTSNVTGGANSSIAVLTDAGNLVLQDEINGNTLWESFQHPSDTLLKTMSISANRRTGEKTRVISWKSTSDPSVGSFSAGVDPSNLPQLVTWKDDRPYWRSGPWNGWGFLGISVMRISYATEFSFVDDRQGTVTFSYNNPKTSVIRVIALDSAGVLKARDWNTGNSSWYTTWEAPENDCDVYGKCGQFGICNAQNSPICSCLGGFEPKNAEEWNRGNWTGGCTRRLMLECERIQNGSEVGKKDGFLMLQTVKVPDFAQWTAATSAQDCKVECSNNCLCIAFSYYDGLGCLHWNGGLIDIQQFSVGGTDLYIRLVHSELGKKSDLKVIIITTVITGAIAFSVCVFLSRRWMNRHRGRRITREVVTLFGRIRSHPKLVEENISGNNVEQVKLWELPLFSLQQLANATDNFDQSNKLGQGGFGPVYKGILPNGLEIAVKRLSRASGQGLEEFINEVEVISKLQHRNLVRLFGCCAEGEEKMLVYEYMPNKSLDVLLFDEYQRGSLDWRKRFSIIEGIVRGLVYLHRDSRLKIIHRDLKASNVLLDKELNPKISDFGIARIFGSKEDQAKTRRVVGTYGYMSPEYAIQGRFSEKSDIFSLGVLLLEIVSGRKNTRFYDSEQSLSLLGSAWKQWKEGNIAELVDPMVYEPRSQVELSRCIHIGLLCVQELAEDRPNVSMVMSMLKSEILDLPTPKQPAFSERNFGYVADSVFEQNSKPSSVNQVTITVCEGR